MVYLYHEIYSLCYENGFKFHLTSAQAKTIFLFRTSSWENHECHGHYFQGGYSTFLVIFGLECLSVTESCKICGTIRPLESVRGYFVVGYPELFHRNVVGVFWMKKYVFEIKYC